MRIDFIGHASLLIRSGATTLLSDPWWEGPAYLAQWYPWPLPVPERHDLSNLSAIYISHGHEDHMHVPTLATLPKAPRVVVPRGYDPGNADYLRGIGFADVCEVASGRSMTLGAGSDAMRLTVVTHLSDSMLVVEAGGEVLVNVNDALHCAREEVIEAYCAWIRRRFAKIDYVFCGYGGASYFPNCFRVPEKDDRQVAARREECFLDNFVRIVRGMRPRIAVPFAAGFVLPAEETWWISAQRLAQPPPASVLGPRLAGAAHVIDLAPGDALVSPDPSGVLRGDPAAEIADIRQAVLDRYPTDAPTVPPVDALAEKIRAMAEQRWRRLGGRELVAVLRFVDAPDEAIVVRSASREISVAPADRVDALRADVTLETRRHVLWAAITEPYGRDFLCIGYGATVRVPRAGFDEGAHERLLELITSFPSWGDHIRAYPVRAVAYLVRDPGARCALRGKIERLLGRSQAVGRNPLYDLRQWA